MKPNLECWTTLAALSTITKRLHLGTLVTAVGFRYPSLLAKITSTLDVISQGRLEFGIGAGWYEPEYRAYGYPFPNTSIRIEQLSEAIQIIKRMWTEEKASFQGKHFHLNDAICNPKPLQKPHPPIWVGGTGRQLMRVIAGNADGWNSVGLTLDEYKGKLQNLAEECQLAGRMPGSIKKSIYTGIIIGRDETKLQDRIRGFTNKYKKKDETTEQYMDRIRRDDRRIVGIPSEIIEKTNTYGKLGVEEVICFFPDLPSLDSMKLFAEEILPHN